MEKTIAFQIVYLYKKFLEFVNRELKNHNINYGQIPFILYIGKHDNCTPSMLKSALKLDWGYSQRSITKLTEQGLILKKYETNAQKKYHLSLTQAGKEIFELCHQLFSDWDQKFLARFSENEKMDIIENFEKIAKQIEGK